MGTFKNKSRITIFCYYDAEGVFGRDSIYLTKELKKVSSKLIIVVNGELKNREDISFADNIIVRENQGYDIGAYKTVIMDSQVNAEIRHADELVFCNSSFYGPFIPFADIFSEADEYDWDFWGISKNTTGINNHIQSYFIVYRKSVIASECFYKYFDHIDETKENHMTSCALFENGFLNYLVHQGFGWGALRSLRYHNIKCPVDSIVADRIPLLKKKVFENKNRPNMAAESALAYLAENTEYDCTLITEDVKRRYGYDIDTAQTRLTELIAEDMTSGSFLFQDLKEFIKKSGHVYIYGCGDLAGRIYSSQFFCTEYADSLLGFIVSDDQNIENEYYFDHRVYHLSEIKNNDAAIIVALSHRNTNEVKPNLASYNSVFYIASDLDRIDLLDCLHVDKANNIYVGNDRCFDGTRFRDIATTDVLNRYNLYEIENIFILNKLTPKHLKYGKYNVAICGIFKDEACYLKEWIDYHLGIGIEHFFLYNNNSSDNYMEVLAPYIDSGELTLIDWPRNQAQLDAYEDCINRYRDECSWIGFIDIDEFIVIKDGSSIAEFLKPFKHNRPSVVFYWKVFGSNGYDRRDLSVPVTEAFHSCNPLFSTNGKCFYNTAYDFYRSDIKKGSFHHRLYAICEGVLLPPVNVFNHVSSRQWNIADSLDFPAWINHYALKSKQEYYAK